MKKAFVTGASRGIGLAIVRQLVLEGIEVVGTFHSTKPANLNGVKYIKVDLQNREELTKVLNDLAGDNFDYIVNCAGVFEEETIDNFDLAKWDKSLEVMLTAPYIIINALVKNMPESGSIVNIVSDDAYLGEYASFGYAVAKAGLINLTRSLGNLLGPRGIRVNAIAPGWVDTDMGPDNSDIAKTVNEITPLGRMATSQEIADTTSFLLSDKSSFMTGSVMFVNGGRTNVDYSLYKEWKST